MSVTRRAFLGAAGGAAVCRAAGRPPNFLFILADDLGWGDLPCYGHQGSIAHGGWIQRGELKMPHLDRMAREGTRFTQFYQASAVCSPSRAALMTGRFPAELGIHDYLATPELNRKRGVVDSLDPATPTVTRLLSQAGYATAHFGKWHLSSGPAAPRPEAYGIGVYKDGMRLGRPRSSEAIADDTIAFLEESRGGPFYAQAWLYDPHSPLHPSEESMALYKELSPRWGAQRGAMEVYYAVLSEMDRQVGRIMARLDELGLGESTLVVFSSDNGPESGLIPFTSHYGGAASAGPFRGLKRSLYEGGIRTPWIARWRGRVPAGRVDDATVLSGVDWLATVCALAQVRAPATSGEDMSGALESRPRARTRPLKWENRYPVYGHVLDQSPMLAVRDGRWKLLMNPDRSRVELYDIPADPTEMNNRARHEPAVVKRLSALALGWQKGLPAGPVDARAGKAEYPWPK